MLTALACCLALAADPTAGTQTPAHLDVQVPVHLDYLLYLPADYEKQPSWPLILFLHGAGERGSDLEMLKKQALPKSIASGKQYPFIIVSPQCPKDKFWEPFELIALLDAVSAKYHVDQDRVYLTGLSMGGFGSWRLAAYAPERFAAMAPICGGGEIVLARRLKSLPIWAFHGAKDPVVPVDMSERMVDAVNAKGGQAKLTIYPEAMHDSWTESYANPELYEWFLSNTSTKNHAAEEKKGDEKKEPTAEKK